MELTKNPYYLQVEKHYPRYSATLAGDRIVIKGLPMWNNPEPEGVVVMVIKGRAMKAANCVTLRMWASVAADKTATYYMGLIEGQLSLATYRRKKKANPVVYYNVVELLVNDRGGMECASDSVLDRAQLV